MFTKLFVTATVLVLASQLAGCSSDGGGGSSSSTSSSSGSTSSPGAPSGSSGAPADPAAGGDETTSSSGAASNASADKVGSQCVKNADCPSNACLFKQNASYGYCSKTCQSFTDCPTFWTCEAVQNGSSKYCTQK